MQLSKLEEHQLLTLQYQEIQKQQQKAWHDRNIENKNLLVGDLALLYNSQVKVANLKSYIQNGWDLMLSKKYMPTDQSD